MKTKSIQQQDEQFRQALQAVPVRNAHVRATPLPEDPQRLEVEVELLYRTPVQRFLRRLLRAYGMIDGRKTYGELVDEFAAAEKLTFFESRALLGQFLQHLARRGLVVATMRKPAP